MITLITGTPGAGKTLYAISKLLRDLVGSVVKSTDDKGNEIETPRRICTNIPRLLLDHELIGPDAGGGLADWQDWCKPGDVIVYDEVQRSWPPRPNGSKVPDFISALETHRHKGVDFIILTQHPMLLDRNVLALVGRHLHVRRFGGIGAALVYEWDHCSRSLLYSKSLRKSPFRYDKSVFKLYLSSELHTKPKTSIPTLAYVVLAALLAAAYFIPTVVERIASKNQKPPSAAAGSGGAVSPDGSPSGGASPKPTTSGAPSPAPSGYDSTAFIPRVSYVPHSAPAYDDLRRVVNMPNIIGGACFKGVCRCVTQQGTDSGLSSDACKTWMDKPPFDPYTVRVPQPVAAPPPPPPAPAVVAQAVTVPMPSGRPANPTGEGRMPSVFPPGSAVHTTQPVDVLGPVPPPSMLHPLRPLPRP